ncbi:MAG: M3 family oligoendopeptidase [Planctomycetota bacterium]
MTTTTLPDFKDINPATPALEKLIAEYDAIERDLTAAASDDARVAAVMRWDKLRRGVDTWSAVTQLRFEQDTTNPAYVSAKDLRDEMSPKIQDRDVRIKRLLLGSEHRAGIEKAIGGHAFALWDSDVAAFDPRIADQIVAESKTESEYSKVMAGAKFEFRGEKLNLPMLRKYMTDPDRETRHDASVAMWGYFAQHGAQLDDIYDRLVKLRTAMSRDLGNKDFVALGYHRMKRIDYGRKDVETFRRQVLEQVVPLASVIYEQQRERLGLDELMAWDEGMFDLNGNPRPDGDHDWMLERATQMFAGMHPELDSFFRMMQDHHLLDLKSRDGKNVGGFCTSFPDCGLPYIFANFNGTKGDVEVFTHEAGHAFQGWKSRGQKMIDYMWPTMESCEIHSMSLEFLTWPHMDKFFGDDAERFRKMHLTQALLFLPYACSVDEFQHQVYENPDATPAERHGMWQELERKYLPQRKWGDLEYPAKGGRWQSQMHIYGGPFYYIDYALAQTCALQFWVRGRENFSQAMTDYIALCTRGGEAPFQALAKGAGLTSPFSEGALDAVVGHARQALGV